MFYMPTTQNVLDTTYLESSALACSELSSWPHARTFYTHPWCRKFWPLHRGHSAERNQWANNIVEGGAHLPRTRPYALRLRPRVRSYLPCVDWRGPALVYCSCYAMYGMRGAVLLWHMVQVKVKTTYIHSRVQRHISTVGGGGQENNTK